MRLKSNERERDSKHREAERYLPPKSGQRTLDTERQRFLNTESQRLEDGTNGLGHRVIWALILPPRRRS